ncbi:MAG: phosphatase PAP2 family protein [Deltaproteobacteria bacterium]|nr:phosphatase PAP2 family protein [Deltaproteobacteria bacterium]
MDRTTQIPEKRQPLLNIPRKYKQAYGLAAGTFALSLYMASNHLLLFEPRYLPFTSIDQVVPFVPASIWIYFSAFILIGIPYFAENRIKEAKKYLEAFFIIAGISVVIFWLWPTTYPRARFPLPAGVDFLTAYIFTSMRSLDSMTNCAPSLHVSGSYIAALSLWSSARSKPRTLFFFVWATIVAVSTMSTKQHYFFDVVSGLLLAVAAHAYVFNRAAATRTIVRPVLALLRMFN